MPLLTSFQIKWIAISLMLVDHIGALLFPEYPFFRVVGRLAFPLFAWQFVLSWTKTSSRIRFIRNIVVFSVISQLPYAIAFRNGHLNIFFLFVLASLALLAFERFRKHWIITVGAFLFASLAAHWLNISYGVYGIWTIAVFYLFQADLFKTLIGLAGVNIFGLLYFDVSYQWVSAFAILLIAMHNQARGRSRVGRWFFYAFYPLHLVGIVALRALLTGGGLYG